MMITVMVKRMILIKADIDDKMNMLRMAAFRVLSLFDLEFKYALSK